ncbi:MAG: glycosyltransferase [Nitrosopumilus sp.]
MNSKLLLLFALVSMIVFSHSADVFAEPEDLLFTIENPEPIRDDSFGHFVTFVGMIESILNYSLAIILIVICGIWTFLLFAMFNSIRSSPFLDKFERQKHNNPKVTVIIPARNEEKDIGRCLDSLLEQTYDNYEIIVIDDSSEDKTNKIILEYAKNNSKVVSISARTKPSGWMGKNWACMEGYKKATGELLLFTDADTVHSQEIISLAVSHLLSCNLDALTVLPHIEIKNIWTRLGFNMMACMGHAQFSPIQINDPSKKIGLLAGSFFILSKKVYDAIGTHEGVKSEIIEDSILGQKAKDLKYKMKMVRGEHLINAGFGGDNSVWQTLNRIVIPSYLKQKKFMTGMFFAGFLFLLFPFLILGYSSLFVWSSLLSFQILFAISLIDSFLIFIAATAQAKILFRSSVIDGLLASLGSMILILGILNGILRAKKDTWILWKQRTYPIIDGNK